MSRSSFAGYFKQAFGRGAIDLLKQARLRLAARLLLSSQRSIKTITRDVGYASRSPFSRAFHDHFGQSPLDYRMAHHWSDQQAGP
jgi:AraC-like DNA-binding protein